jgi:hypothetical protein
MDAATRYEIGLPMDDQINVKMTKALKERLNKMYAVKGVAPAEILRRLAYEAVIYFEIHGDFSFPATITPGMKNQTQCVTFYVSGDKKTCRVARENGGSVKLTMEEAVCIAETILEVTATHALN